MFDMTSLTRPRVTTIKETLVGAGAVAAAGAASPFLRRRFNHWGATRDEVASAMPGDDLVRQPKLGYTRAITINAPPTLVWPWLAQIGQGRGGFYSYDSLENLVGCDIHSSDEILTEHQHLAVGDLIRSGLDNFPCWMVMAVQPPDHLVLLGAGTPANVAVPDTPVEEIPPEVGAASTWQWQLRPNASATTTRLIVRQRLTYSPGRAITWRLVEPVNFAMERRMLIGLKARAEHTVTPT